MGLTRLRAEQISDIDYKQAVRVITVTDIANLSGGAPSQVDGVNLSVGDRILVTAQDPGSENGIYQVQTTGTGSNGTWIRSIDTNQTGELEAGTIVMVTEGTVYADTQWKLTTNNPIIIGTTPLTFVQNSADAFGNIYANGTAILANAVGSSLTLLPGDNIEITGNNTTKTVTIAVTGVSTSNISNGNSNVSVVSSGGNVTVGINGTSNIAEFSTSGLKISGFVSATGNITGNFFNGNGSALTGISSFSNITVTGGNSILADSMTDTLTLAAGNGISITAYAGNDTVIISSASSSQSIFATGGTMGLVTESVDSSEDLGLVTEAATTQYDLGGLGVDGVVTNDSIADYTITGNKFANNIAISTTGNVTAAYFIGDGSLLTNVGGASTYANANVIAYAQSGWSGNIVPGANATYNLGSSSALWKDLYLSGNSLYLGNIVLKSAPGNNLAIFGADGVTPGGISATISTLSNGLSSLSIASANANIVATVANTTVATISTSGISVSGNTTSNFFISPRTITANTTIGNTNAMAVGPITISDNVVVTINSGGEWSIV